jgi:hypothetical protein
MYASKSALDQYVLCQRCVIVSCWRAADCINIIRRAKFLNPHLKSAGSKHRDQPPELNSCGVKPPSLGIIGMQAENKARQTNPKAKHLGLQTWISKSIFSVCCHRIEFVGAALSAAIPAKIFQNDSMIFHEM